VSDRDAIDHVGALPIGRGWTYRLRQLIAALTARVRPDERALLARILNDEQVRLFETMPRFDQRHSLDVYYALARAGYDHPQLLQAALLHDCGKVDSAGRTIPLLYYGLIVILQHSAPRLYIYAARHGHGPLRPFAVHAGHEQRSATYAAAAGSDPVVVQILRDYATKRSTPLTSALRAADDMH